jgi:hypothetical protein
MMLIARWTSLSESQQQPLNEYPMLLRLRGTDQWIEVRDLKTLMSPIFRRVKGRRREGDPSSQDELFDKTALTFPSGEDLPLNWRQVLYRLQPVCLAYDRRQSNPGIPPRQHLQAR